MNRHLQGWRKALALAIFSLGAAVFAAGFLGMPLAACNNPSGCNADFSNLSLNCSLGNTNNTTWCTFGAYNCTDYPYYLWDYTCYSTQMACTNIYTNTTQYCSYCTWTQEGCCFWPTNEPGCYYNT